MKLLVSRFVVALLALFPGMSFSLFGAAPAFPFFPEAAQPFFADTALVQLKILLPDSAVAALRTHPRTNVLAVLQEGRTAHSNVLLHLKGTSTFRPVDSKPSFTLHFQGTPFHGLARLHLNNSVEDPSYLNEYLGSLLFHAAGLPAPRVAHATVELNGRVLGLYVLKEGYSASPGSTSGELYEPGQGHDVHERLRLISGREAQRTKLQQLAMAAAEPNLPRRWAALQRSLEVDHFASFMALEILLNHWDGYCLARNNFRLYRDPGTDRFIFLPHGMDQLFGKANATLTPRMSGVVAAAFLEVPQGRALYRTKLQQLATDVLQASSLHQAIEKKAAMLEPVLAPAERRAFQREAAALKERITARQQNVQAQIASWSLLEPRFIGNNATLTNWSPASLGNKGRLNVTQAGQLHIQAEPGTAAAWKTRLVLNPGRYRFSALVQTQEVRAKRPIKHPGARLRVSGHTLALSQSLTGTHPWKKLEISFTVLNTEKPVEMFCELSADSGEAQWDSLLLERVSEEGRE